MAKKNRNQKRRRPGKPKPIAAQIQPTKREAPPSAAESTPQPTGLGLHLGARPLAWWRGAAIPAGVALAALAICLAVAVAFFPATRGELIWDSFRITKAAPVQSAAGIWQIWFAPRSLKPIEGHYWPLLYTTFWLEHKLWGFNPAGYHIVNLLLHALVSLLLWRLLYRLGVPGAWLSAAVFAVHPVHVESVAWVIGRKDLLSGLFALASALAYLNFVDTRQRKHYAWALVLFTLSLFSKSIAVTLPVSLLLWHWWKANRVTSTDLTRVLPLILLGLVITIADWAEYNSREIISFDLSLPERALIAARALWFYASKLVWPTDLAVIYPRWDISVADPRLWGYLIGALALATALWCLRDRIGRGPLAGALFFTITLTPVLGFVDYGYMQFSYVADRYQYLASIGITAILVGAAAHGARHLAGVWRRGAQALVVALLMALGALSWQQSGIYQDPGTFFSHILALNPKALGAHIHLGNWLSKQGRHEEALEVFRAALEQTPDSAEVVNHIGIVYKNLKQLDKAEKYFRDALHLDPRHLLTMTNLALTMIEQQRLEEGLKLYQEALKINRKSVQAQIGMAVTFDLLKQLEQAKKHYRLALNMAPDNLLAMTNLALLLTKQRQYHEGIGLYRKALQIAPGHVSAHIGLGMSLYGLGRHREALESFDRALSLQPSSQLAQNYRQQTLQILQTAP